MAQQASPNVAGHSELFRTRPATFSTVERRIPLGIFSSMPMDRSVPLEAAAPPDVYVGNEDGDDEEGHLDQPEDRWIELLECDGPRIEEDDLDIEDDEEHGGQVVLDGEAAAAGRLRSRLDAAFIGIQLRPVVTHRPG